jgi:tetratricopeptide (TPR) repeat protein
MLQRKTFFAFGCLLFSYASYAQNNTLDSLLKIIDGAKSDSVKARLYIEAGNWQKQSLPDSALYFFRKAELLAGKNTAVKEKQDQQKYMALQATAIRFAGNIHLGTGNYEKARELYSHAAPLFEKAGDLKGLSACYSNTGVTYSIQGDYDKAINEYERALKIAKKLEDPGALSQSYSNIGIVYDEKGQYDKALEYFLSALKIDEKSGDDLRTAGAYSNIGIVYKAQGLYDKSLTYYKKALEIYEKIGEKKQMSDGLNNLGNVYMALKNYDQALDCYNRALKITGETGDRRGMSATLSNMGNLHHALGEYNKVEDYYQKSLAIKNEIGDRYGMALLYTNLADLYISLTDSAALTESQKKTYLLKATSYAQLSYQMGQEMGVIPWINSAAGTLMTAYKKQGLYQKALEYAEIFIKTNDSLISSEQTRILAEMESRYENEKKQLLIDKMESQKIADDKTILAQQAENRRQQIILISVVAGLIIILVFSVIVFRMFRQKRRDNILLAQQNNEIRQQKEEILSQRDEIMAQRDVLHVQKKEITDSITYAKRIQTALLPDLNLILCGNQHVSGFFILYKPRDIVSGDFYWATRVNEWLLFTVADCTGHGVPGAFMSMLGVSYLNEIVRKKEITDAAAVLNHLRDAVIESLKQQKGFSKEIMDESVKDGMDIAFCALNTTTLELQFAGANNPLYIIKPAIEDVSKLVFTENHPCPIPKGWDDFQRLPPLREGQEVDENHEKDSFETASLAVGQVTTEANSQQSPDSYREANSRLIELKGDKMPIGIHERMSPFTLHKIQLQQGDSLYLCSDGFADQYGEKTGKKFMVKKLKELLLQNAGLSHDEQKQMLAQTFDEWKGAGKQIDDVTILGITV